MVTSAPTTPEPQYEIGPGKSDPAPALDMPDKMHMRAAAFRATQLYPNIVGEFLGAEILAWEEYGWRLGGHGRVMQLVHHVMTARLDA